MMTADDGRARAARARARLRPRRRDAADQHRARRRRGRARRADLPAAQMDARGGLDPERVARADTSPTGRRGRSSRGSCGPRTSCTPAPTWACPPCRRDCRIAIRAARLIYADIGRRVRHAGYDSVSRRAVVSSARKIWLILRALGARFGTVHGMDAPPLGPTRFLVAACAETP